MVSCMRGRVPTAYQYSEQWYGWQHNNIRELVVKVLCGQEYSTGVKSDPLLWWNNWLKGALKQLTEVYTMMDEQQKRVDDPANPSTLPSSSTKAVMKEVSSDRTFQWSTRLRKAGEETADNITITRTSSGRPDRTYHMYVRVFHSK